MVQKGRVHGLANGIVAPERERDVGYPSAYFGMRQVFFNPSGCIDKIDRIVVVFFQTGCYG
ncbi:hypothetical protein D3C87_1776110 [compost metagenome]